MVHESYISLQIYCTIIALVVSKAKKKLVPHLVALLSWYTTQMQGGGKYCNVVGILICIGENLLVDSHYVPI